MAEPFPTPATRAASPRRLSSYLLVTFAVTWGAWWTLVLLARGTATEFGEPLYMMLFMLGGFGPTIAAYVAVVRSPAEGSLAEFHSRLLRWRVGAAWYAAAFGLPLLLAAAGTALAAVIDPSFAGTLRIREWWWIVPLFVVMILGGGLEELGWRGVAQPALEQRIGRSTAALIVGVVWAVWHLPLFVLPGTGQYGTSFPIFAVGVVGAAFALAWLYGATRSIFLCVMFHAAYNAVLAMGLAVPTSRTVPALADAGLRLVVGSALLLATRRRRVSV